MAGRREKFAKQAAVLAAQAKAGRKLQEGIREPNGRLSRSAMKLISADSVGEIRRMRDAALMGMREAIWGTQLGRLYMCEKINGEQFRAGRNWAGLITQWRAVHGGPRFDPKSGLESLDRVAGGSGQSEGSEEREQMLKEMFDDAVSAFSRGMASAKLSAVRRCVEQDLAPVGYGGMLLLVDGLDRLAQHWKAEG